MFVKLCRTVLNPVADLKIWKKIHITYTFQPKWGDPLYPPVVPRFSQLELLHEIKKSNKMFLNDMKISI